MNKITLSANGNENIRLDKFLSNHISNLSRTQIKQIILDGFVHVNESLVKPSIVLDGSEIITYSIPRSNSDVDILEPENMNIDILYEDDYLVAIDKPVVIRCRANKLTVDNEAGKICSENKTPLL